MREVLSEQTKEVLDADGGRSYSDVPPEAQQDLSSEHLQPVSEEHDLCTKQPRDPEADSSRDSSPHKDISSTPDVCNESMNRSPPRSSAARKSLVPVAVSTGLFDARTSSVDSSHFDLRRSLAFQLRSSTLTPDPRAVNVDPRSSLSSPPL